MRNARFDDLKRALERRAAGDVPVIKEFAVQGLRGFADFQLLLNSGFLAICGGTGVGKTALLDTIYAGLVPSEPVSETHRRSRLIGANVKITMRFPQGEFVSVRKIDDAEGEQDIEYTPGVEFIELVERTSLSQDYFLEKDIATMKQGLDPSLFDKDLLEAVSQICRKSYKQILVYEIESNNDRIVYLFEVVDDEVSYDNRTMATGELSALNIAWAVRSSPVNSVILIEEPEAYLPPVGHSPMFGLIAQAALKQKLCVVLTTHSPIIASHVPDAGLLSVKRVGTLSHIPSGREPRLKVLARLGLRPVRNAIIFVEDELASLVVRESLSMHDLLFTSNIEIVNTKDGVGGVKRALENLPDNIRSFECWGILDGDQMGKIADWRRSQNVLFLPFLRSIEQEMLEAIESNAKRFARATDRPLTLIVEGIEAGRGDDPHDRLRSLSASVGMSPEALAPVAFRHWAKQPKKKTAVRKFIEELSARLKIVRP